MKHFNALTLALPALGFLSMSKAQPDPNWFLSATKQEIPFVVGASTDITDFFAYPATLLGSSGDESTYGVSCYAESTSICFGYQGWTSMTLISSPKTMAIMLKDASEQATKACTLTGNPFPTTGSCSETYITSDDISGTHTETVSYTVPSTSTVDILTSLVFSESIYTATFNVLQATVTSTGSEGKSTSTGASKTGTGAGASGSGSNTATGTVSHNAAMITNAPSWMLIAGVVAGAAIRV